MAIDTTALLSYTRAELGKKYVYGAAGPDTFDCSGLTQFVFGHFGISLPHRSQDQARLGTPVGTHAIQAGDLVFSDWGDGPNSHVGIAVSPSQVIDAPHTGALVRYDTLSPSYLAHVTAVRRVGDLTGAGAAATPVGLRLGGVDPLSAIADAIRDVTAPLAAGGRLADQIFKIFMPSNIVRLAAGVAGAAAIGWGLLLLGREMRG